MAHTRLACAVLSLWLGTELATLAGASLYEDLYDDNWYFDDDFYGYDSSYTDLFDYFDYFDAYDDECIIDTVGNYVVNGTRPCDLRVTGGEEATSLASGFAGLYVYAGCQNGRPMYERLAGASLEDRFIIYSSYWGDWDFSSEDILSDDSTLGYGGEGDGEKRPQLVTYNDWYILKDLSAEDVMEDFVYAPSLSVECNFNCSDHTQNGLELGVDCGGPDCAECVYDEDFLLEQEIALAQLRAKVKAEQTTDLSPFEKLMIAFLALIGGAIVCGGPIMYFVKQNARKGTMASSRPNRGGQALNRR